MSPAKHSGSFEVIARDFNNRATSWLATCSCRTKFAGPTYEFVEDQWREHVFLIKGEAPTPCGDKTNRWMPVMSA